jgi:hypothetical protein
MFAALFTFKVMCAFVVVVMLITVWLFAPNATHGTNSISGNIFFMLILN